jgi:hypothetical protein
MKKSIYERLEVGTATGGHAKVTIKYYGKYYTGVITDMSLYDDFRREAHIFNTPLQAAQIMYNIVKRQNNL